MIKIDNISFSYGKHRILNKVSFEIPEKQCIGLIGANGCGKSTLLSIIAGIRKPTSGKIIAPKGSIGYVPQENPLMPELSGYDNLLLWFGGSRKALKEKLQSDLISSLGINEYIKKPVKSLSGGMKKKLSIAMALINDPALMIMDEPGAALDLPSKAEIDEYLRTYVDGGGSIIITTHDEAELDLCDKLLVLNKGILHEIPNNTRGSELIKELTGGNK